VSQYPGQYPPPYQGGVSPYQVPGQQWSPLEHLLAPAKRAGALMIVLGVIGILCGACFGVVGLNWNQLMQNPSMPQQQRQVIAQAESQLGGSLGPWMVGVAVVVVVVAVSYIVLGIVALRGGAFGIFGSMILVAIVGLLLLLLMAGTLLQAVQAAGPETAINGCAGVLGLGSHALLFVWLLGAARNVRRIREMKDYQQNYWAYLRQQQAAYPQQQPAAYPGYAPGAYPGYPPQGQPPVGAYGPQAPPQPPQQQPPQQPPGHG
jgi:hypothetical protein